MGEIGDSSPAARDPLSKAVERYRDLLATGFARARLGGAVRADRNANAMADVLFDGSPRRWTATAASPPARRSIDRLLAH